MAAPLANNVGIAFHVSVNGGEPIFTYVSSEPERPIRDAILQAATLAAYGAATVAAHGTNNAPRPQKITKITIERGPAVGNVRIYQPVRDLCVLPAGAVHSYALVVSTAPR